MSTTPVTPFVDPTPVFARIRPFLAPGSRPRERRPPARVTEIRSGGVGRPTHPAAATDTTPDLALVADAVATGLESVAVLEMHSRELADGLRWNQISEVTRGLVHLVKGIRTLMSLAALTASASGMKLEELCRLDDLSAQEDTQAALDQLLSQQIARDWPAVSETLDDILPAALDQWRAVFETLGRSPMDPCGHAA